MCEQNHRSCFKDIIDANHTGNFFADIFNNSLFLSFESTLPLLYNLKSKQTPNSRFSSADKNSLKHSSSWKSFKVTEHAHNSHWTLSGTVYCQKAENAGCSHVICNKTVLHFNKVALPLSALLCNDFVIYTSPMKPSEIKCDRRHLPAAGRHNTFKKQLTPHSPYSKAAIRALPQPCQQLVCAAWNKQAQRQPSSPAHLLQSGKSSYFNNGNKNSVISPQWNV